MPSKKNRDYTGLERTPPSMAWLIRERAVLRGKLDLAQKQLDALPRQILELQERLKALRKLRESKGQALYTSEIALYIAREAGIDIPRHEKPRLIRCVCKRLKSMVNQGLVQRHHRCFQCDQGTLE